MNRKFQTAIFYLLVAIGLLLLPTYASSYRGVTGKLLVATPGVTAPFSQSVIFVGQHNLFSAWGVIVNRPFAWKTGKKKMPAYFGGPVDCPTHMIGPKDDGSLQIAVNDDKTAGSVKDKRVVIGCSGWGLLQLNFELTRGGWDVIDYDPALVFDTPADKVWDAAHDRALQDRVTKQKKVTEPYNPKK